ncbi:MAG: hypothetical protein RL077_5711 [Verrucomicrobiota bacterium]|jgi:O-succinylbenzoic acid--CoA ligase
MERAELMAVLRATGCLERRGGYFFLRDPQSKPIGNVEAVLAMRVDGGGLAPGDVNLGWLGVATGGTSGQVKWARHDEQTLSAAVRGFGAHFQMERVNAVDVLPPFHVSGLMARVRCAATGGAHLPWAWKQLEAGDVPRLPAAADGWVISLVPTQLQRLLRWPALVAWLRGFRLILLGGGPVWPTLAEAAGRAELRIALSYGMTETAAMVTALLPEAFLAGERSNGRALPHAAVRVDEDGLLRVAGASLFRGYFPEEWVGREFVTEDFGQIDAQGQVWVHGRRDTVIITGGKKVLPAEVEAALLASGELSDVVVLGVRDAEWGEVVVACYPTESGRAPDLGRAVVGLAAYQRPKRWRGLAVWPRNVHGKINRAALREQWEGT